MLRGRGFSSGCDQRKTLMKSLLSVLTCIFLFGCASIAGPSEQPVAVEVRSNGAEVRDVACTLTNSRGTWAVNAPGRVVITKSASPLQVRCEKRDVGSGSATLTSSKSALVAAAILTGGSASGSATGGAMTAASEDSYLYPTSVTVTLTK
jgi:hypothetical protein